MFITLFQCPEFWMLRLHIYVVVFGLWQAGHITMWESDLYYNIFVYHAYGNLITIVNSQNFNIRIIVEFCGFKKDNSCVYWIFAIRFISLVISEIVILIIV